MRRLDQLEQAAAAPRVSRSSQLRAHIFQLICEVTGKTTVAMLLLRWLLGSLKIPLLLQHLHVNHL